MKFYYTVLVPAMLGICIMIMFQGCEYDVAEPQWDKTYTEPLRAGITKIDPEGRAAPGVNIITIEGQNFEGVPAANGVFFDNVTAEIIENTGTILKVRRPNLVAEGCTLKVVSSTSLVVAKMGPYKIDPVLSTYGSFVEGLELGALAVDNNENVYVVEALSKIVRKVTSASTDSLTTVTRSPLDMTVGPDGRLYLMANNRSIEAVDVNTGQVTEWVRTPTGKVVRFGDFDSEGYLYTGGARTDLITTNGGATPSFNSTGYYASEEILAIRVHGNYVYVASRDNASDSTCTIYRHALTGGGNVGAKELIIDFASDPKLTAAGAVSGIAVSADNKIYVSTYSAAPYSFLVIDMNTKAGELFYKGILPPYTRQFNWGTGNNLYMVSGNTTAGQTWNVYRVDMGSNAAQ